MSPLLVRFNLEIRNDGVRCSNHFIGTISGHYQQTQVIVRKPLSVMAGEHLDYSGGL